MQAFDVDDMRAPVAFELARFLPEAALAVWHASFDMRIPIRGTPALSSARAVCCLRPSCKPGRSAMAQANVIDVPVTGQMCRERSPITGVRLQDPLMVGTAHCRYGSAVRTQLRPPPPLSGEIVKLEGEHHLVEVQADGSRLTKIRRQGDLP